MDPASLIELAKDIEQQKRYLIQITDTKSFEFLQTESSIEKLQDRIAELERQIIKFNLGDDYVTNCDLKLCKVLADIHSNLESFQSTLKISLPDAATMLLKIKEKLKNFKEPNIDPDLFRRIILILVNWQGKIKAAVEEA